MLESFKTTVESIFFRCLSKRFTVKPVKLSFAMELFIVILHLGPDPGFDEVEDII